jgi:hypothetical protein
MTRFKAGLHRHRYSYRRGDQGIPRTRRAVLRLAQPVPPASVFDLTLQGEINKELGIK